MKNNFVCKKNICKFTVFACLCVQIVLICVFWNTKQLSDYAFYENLAFESYNNDTWYPSYINMYEKYIFAPGLINYFIVQLHFFGSLKFNLVSNFILNIGIIYFVYKIAQKFFSKNVAYLSVTLYCLLYSTWFSVVPNGTEVPFLFLSLFAIYIILYRLEYIFFAGILFALANWIRPLAVIYIFFVVIYMIYQKISFRKYFYLLLPFVVTIVIIAYNTNNRIGNPVFQSTTSGINLILTANEKAYGGVATSLINDSSTICYIKDRDKYTYIQQDSIWKERAISWIKENPFKYVTLYFIKIPGLFSEDAWPDRAVFFGAGYIDKVAHGKVALHEALGYLLKLLAKSFVFYIIMLLSIYTMIRKRKDIITNKGLILIIAFCGIAITNLFSVSPRYHYPFLFVFVIWAAYGLNCMIENKSIKI